MKNLKLNAITILALLALMVMSISSANAKFSIFTDHQVVYMVQHGVNLNQDVQYPTGNYPYLGRVGVEYELERFSYSLSYIHRSNVDISGGDEYNYNGVSLGLKYKYCLSDC